MASFSRSAALAAARKRGIRVIPTIIGDDAQRGGSGCVYLRWRAIDVPGMRILQFAFSQANSPHLPHCYEPRTVVYTGTHDNDTALGWYTEATPAERDLAATYLGVDGHGDISWSLIRAAFTSVAQTAIVPVQDILSLGSDARMNRPGNGTKNGSWRFLPGALARTHAERLRHLAEITGRI